VKYTDKSRVILGNFEKLGKKYQEVGFSRQGGASRSFGRCIAVFDTRDKISKLSSRLWGSCTHSRLSNPACLHQIDGLADKVCVVEKRLGGKEGKKQGRIEKILEPAELRRSFRSWE